jgi:hypothetical protein
MRTRQEPKTCRLALISVRPRSRAGRLACAVIRPAGVRKRGNVGCYFGCGPILVHCRFRFSTGFRIMTKPERFRAAISLSAVCFRRLRPLQRPATRQGKRQRSFNVAERQGNHRPGASLKISIIEKIATVAHCSATKASQPAIPLGSVRVCCITIIGFMDVVHDRLDAWQYSRPRPCSRWN